MFVLGMLSVLRLKHIDFRHSNEEDEEEQEEEEEEQVTHGSDI